MKSRKSALLMLVGLLLVAFAVAMAQTPAQGDQKKNGEACCAMETCCCNSGSCPLKQEGATADTAEGCCCSGDSCQMATGKDAKDHSCCNESCDMKKHDGKHHEGKADCCNIKSKTKHKAKQKAA